MSAYADTGFIVSLYKEETTSADANSAIRSVEAPILLSEFSVLEFRNATNLALFRKEITGDARAIILQRFESDLEAGIFRVLPVPSSKLYATSARLSDAHSASIGMRSLDLMHVAAAMILGADTFLSSDSRQREAAKREGLTVLP